MVAHEINNLLTPLTNYAQLALMNPDDDKLAEKALEKTVRLGTQAAEILQQVPVLAGQQKTHKIPYSIEQLFEDVFSALARDFKKDRIRVHSEISEGLMASIDPVGMRQVLMNLLLNAREAMLDGGGRIDITAQTHTEGAKIRIADTGCGMETEQMARIFEPFFTTKDGQDGQRKGSGVGLAFCRRVVENHGGTINVQSKAGEGTVFTICLPGDS